jgi:hypothetical protein
MILDIPSLTIKGAQEKVAAKASNKPYKYNRNCMKSKQLSVRSSTTPQGS